MILIPLIPIMALVIQNLILLSDVIERKDNLLVADKSVLKSDETARLIASLQRERTASLMQIFLTNTSRFTTGSVSELDLDFIRQRAQTDEALENITDWRDFTGETMFQSKLRLQIRIDDFRELQDNRNLSSKEQNEQLALDSQDFYTYTTRVLLDDLSNIIIASNGSRTWRYLVTYKNMLRAIESLGVEISYGIIFLGKEGELSPDDYANYVEKHFLCREYMLQSQSFISRMRESISFITESEQYKQYILSYQNNIQRTSKTNDTEKQSQQIFNYFLKTFDVISMLRRSVIFLRLNMNELIAEELEGIDREFFLAIAIIVLLSIASPVIVMVVKNAVLGLQLFSDCLRVKAIQLKKEKRRADGLIYQMLPKSVAENLRQNKNTSEMFDSATVCFTEIDEFNNISRVCDPLQLFDLLNTLYKTFDARIDNNDVYKVETINDTYMVASGLPERNGDRHAAEIANLCLELMAITPSIMVMHDPGMRLKIRSKQKFQSSLNVVKLISHNFQDWYSLWTNYCWGCWL